MLKDPMAQPMTQPTTELTHFEDIVLGVPITSAPMIVTSDQIIQFARVFDPQPMHLDDEAAKASIVGGLCASGVHTCGLMMRLLCDRWLNHTASLGAPGLDALKWLKPVRPGDALALSIVFESKRVMASRPDVGIVKAVYQMTNQHGEAVLQSSCPQLLRVRRPQAAASTAERPVSSSVKTKTPSLWEMPGATSPSPDAMYFEDRAIGEMIDLGAHTFSADEIISFARQFDPQPFHLDEAAGKRSLFGGLAASGWHTVAHYIRLLVTERMRSETALRARGLPVAGYGPSPGMTNLSWLKPVLAGDTISFRTMITEQVDLKSRPTRGLLKSRGQGRNQRGELVFDYGGLVLVERRHAFVA